MKKIENFNELSKFIDYSFINNLNCDPKANKDGYNHNPREVYSGHYVPVLPTSIKNPEYITHSKIFFDELGFDDDLVKTSKFQNMFTGETSLFNEPFKKEGWACGYALSIYGTEYYQQCPFQTGNGYGDGRAISILEIDIDNKHWEMQLKGGGRTPYCRGADGRAVLRSSIREFLAQEHMHALGVPTSRSLSLYTSKNETVKRPWFNDNSYSRDPEVMIEEKVAISTRVASSFIRVGHLELFGRRTRKNEYPHAKEELEKIVLHVIEREYKNEIDQNLTIEEKIILLAEKFCDRLTSLVVNWIRVGYCQGNFNGDNCSVGGFTLDYGPFGFMDNFDPKYQSWTGGGVHFSFFNQSEAAKRNFKMFCKSLEQLVPSNEDVLRKIDEIKNNFPKIVNEKIEKMWSQKLGIENFDKVLFDELIELMIETTVDYTIFFRELSYIPNDISNLEKSFYKNINKNDQLKQRWINWFEKWNQILDKQNISKKNTSEKMKSINPKYTLREWFLVEAYEKANEGDYSMVKELQEVFNKPYEEQSKEINDKYYIKKPANLFNIAGISYVSCSS